MVANNLGLGSRAAHNWVRAVIAEKIRSAAPSTAGGPPEINKLRMEWPMATAGASTPRAISRKYSLIEATTISEG